MKKRILIIDDEPEFTSMLKLSLETLGYYEVHKENEATAAVASARQFDPDLVVLDIMMPEVDGSEVASRLRADPTLRDVPIVFMTALVLRDEAPLGSCSRGGHTFLPKHSPVEKVIECIEVKLGNREPAMVG